MDYDLAYLKTQIEYINAKADALSYMDYHLAYLKTQVEYIDAKADALSSMKKDEAKL